jgi:hypothetical protein
VTKEATTSVGANVTYSLPTATDDVAVASVVCVPPSGTQFPLGNTLVTCTATDTSGNKSQSTFTVRVVDTTPPKVTVPTTITVPKSSSPAGTVVTFVVTATDLVNGTVAVTCTPGSGTLFAVGDTTVRCTATDSRGNTSVATFVVRVLNRPTSKEDCKKDGWQAYGIFKNQGDCVSYVATGGKNRPAGP